MPVNSFSACGRAVRPSAIMEAVKAMSASNAISFAVGNPAPESFPVDQLRECYDHVLSRCPTAALQYSTTEGYEPLRELIAARMQSLGVAVTAQNILITSGATQALDLISRVLLDPGEPVLVDEPMYAGTLHTLAANGASFLAAPSDPYTGIDASVVQDILGHHQPRLIYTVANFHNPLGSTVPLAARQRLSDLSQAHGVPIVEDDAYGALFFDHTPPPPPIKSFDTSDTVIYLGSFSKVLAPGIRVGWLVASGELFERLLWMKQGTDMVTSGLTQMVVYEFCQRGWIEPQVARVRDLYQERRDAMIQALQAHFPSTVTWSQPKGGMFLWVTLPVGCDADALLPRAMAEGVLYMPGSAFAVPGAQKSTSELCRGSMRLNFSNAPADQIPEGIARLGRVITEFLVS